MDKTKEYKIINTLTTYGEISDNAKHRIGRIGKFIRLSKNMRFEFVSKNPENCLRSSMVTNIEENSDIIKVYTLNTIYIFQLCD